MGKGGRFRFNPFMIGQFNFVQLLLKIVNQKKAQTKVIW